MTAISRKVDHKGFTLIELVVVVMIIGLVSGLLLVRVGTVSFWDQESFLRKLSETIVFLHHQAVMDQTTYALEIDLEKNSYKVGAVKVEEGGDSHLAELAQDAGTISLELAAFLNPSMGTAQSIIPPPSFPSLAEEVIPPRDIVFDDVRTMRGISSKKDGKVYIFFSPRGFSEFAVIHLLLADQKPATILVNPFTGLTEIYREYKDFEWAYGRKKAQN